MAHGMAKRLSIQHGKCSRHPAQAPCLRPMWANFAAKRHAVALQHQPSHGAMPASVCPHAAPPSHLGVHADALDQRRGMHLHQVLVLGHCSRLKVRKQGGDMAVVACTDGAIRRAAAAAGVSGGRGCAARRRR